ncbi:ATP-dependent helicase HrpB [Actinoallomurus sp. NBC_01490]|uniref:ATP-dependent helicase HrpB n=1 Tax=Actinoallomurus sp. NBC_01490 TaxID=2903557 RepID=UPI002E3361BB|nr:ATP-dependent helicase HrpB [Actinoallomurus sp. NBC_01490]
MRSFDLPVAAALPGLRGALDSTGAAVLAAPPGTGKTTLVPLALAETGRRVIVAEPRRLAARAAARRMAWMLGEPVGERVGYAIRGERRPGSAVEVVTTGVLLQRLQHDPDVRADVVILDECHERHLDADTALAFLLDVRAALRPDLGLVAASATAGTAAWARLLGGAPVVTADAAAHPVETVWAPPPRPVRPPHGLSVDPALLDHVARTVRRALEEGDGDVLCFLPGVRELGRVAGALTGLEVLQLHGRAPAEVQEAALRPREGGSRRVVLATSVAESSLTVPGVRAVVDSGLSREPRVDHARGLGTLTTVRSSRATADQRAGRAGREAPGRVYRCWSAAEHDRLPEQPRPEIELADLTGFALQAACWGDPDAAGLALLDPPPPAALRAARATLRAIGAVEDDGRATGRGREMARVGVHPRLARALIDGAAHVGERAAEVVALLSDDRRSGDDDLVAQWRTRRREPSFRDETRRLRRALPAGAEPSGGGVGPSGSGAGVSGRVAVSGPDDETAAGIVVALAFPERVARARDGGYLMASGTAAVTERGSRLTGAGWLAIAVADRAPRAPSARVRQAVPIDEETARLAVGATVEEEVVWRDGDVVARRVERLGAIELGAVPLENPDPELVRAALREGLRREGLGLLNWTREAEALRARLAFCHRELGPPWPAMDDDALLASLDPASAARDRAGLRRLDVTAALRGLLPWECAARLDEVAPERVTVPSGSRIRIDYTGERPVLAAKLQELFGWQEAPRVAGVPLVVHLLSPAGRPAAVTADLASFWREGYRSVRAELRGRYPRHPWPEDPATAEPTRRTNARRR